MSDGAAGARAPSPDPQQAGPQQALASPAEELRVRAAAAVAALATAVVGTFAGLNAQLVLVAAVLIVPLLAEREARTADGAAGEAADAAGGGDAAG